MSVCSYGPVTGGRLQRPHIGKVGCAKPMTPAQAVSSDAAARPTLGQMTVATRLCQGPGVVHERRSLCPAAVGTAANVKLAIPSGFQ